MVPQAKTERREAEVAAVLDRWISPKLLADPWHRTRARLCLGFSLLAIFGFTTVNIVGLYATGALVHAAVFGSVMLAVVPLLVRIGADLRYSAVVLLGTTYLGVFLNAVEVGGLIGILSWSGIRPWEGLPARSLGGTHFALRHQMAAAMAGGHLSDHFQPFCGDHGQQPWAAVRLAVMGSPAHRGLSHPAHVDEHRALALEIDEALLPPTRPK
jgi:hypothetical protein